MSETIILLRVNIHSQKKWNVTPRVLYFHYRLEWIFMRFEWDFTPENLESTILKTRIIKIYQVIPGAHFNEVYMSF